MGDFYKNKTVLVTGASGFIGSHLVERLISIGANVKAVGRKNSPQFLSSVMNKIDYITLDLSKPENCVEALKDVHHVFHLASTVAAIQYSKDHHATMFTPDVIMTINLMNACSQSNTFERILLTSSSCIYRRGCPVPFKEEDGFVDDPEPTAYGYGWAKRVAETTANMYKQQFSLKSAIVRLENVYGPRDNFDPTYAHVIPSLIQRVHDVKDELIIWGDGNQTRSFLYVDDAVDGMLLALEKFAVSKPLNLASGNEVTINFLAKTILELMGKSDIKLTYDSSKPTGQVKKASSIEKMKKILDYTPRTSMYDGLSVTIDWAISEKILDSKPIISNK